MGADTKPFKVFIGFDSREAVCSDVLAHSIRRHTKTHVDVSLLKHRELREAGHFARPWFVDADTGNWRDGIDGKPFSTEFSHTRFLVPYLMGFKGWALFTDCDMIFLSDIEKLLSKADSKFAAMVVKHNHIVKSNAQAKMDGREQLAYHRKNWSSFVLWNCGHIANRDLTPERVNFMKGRDLHAFNWLDDSLIGSLPFTYNYITGVSPRLATDRGGRPDVVHYTDGGPWFEKCRNVPYAQMWLDGYEDWQRNGGDYTISEVPSVSYETEGKRK